MSAKVFFRLFPAAAIVGLAAGCANLYVANYLPAPGNLPRGVPATPSEKLQVVVTTHFTAETKLMEQQGYVVIGTSTFETNSDWSVSALRRIQAEKQAEAVGADLVILNTKVIGEYHGDIELNVGGNPDNQGDVSTYEAELKCQAVYLRKTPSGSTEGPHNGI